MYCYLYVKYDARLFVSSCGMLFKCPNCSLIFFNFHLNIAMFVCCSNTQLGLENIILEVTCAFA
jgi:hypothetical protein